ncbi:hypothetical protein Dda_4764 [Drechslerella dactyloides]|uniref:Uncharacterized protein n=1 Tax=Drechslerella dactyloides TaxID=74499 RepID=A0AAD6IXI5_DREDA|nr:hypothetical protein Dda_4764 [Drechslerella dactyloides]
MANRLSRYRYGRTGAVFRFGGQQRRFHQGGEATHTAFVQPSTRPKPPFMPRPLKMSQIA